MCRKVVPLFGEDARQKPHLDGWKRLPLHARTRNSGTQWAMKVRVVTDPLAKDASAIVRLQGGQQRRLHTVHDGEEYKFHPIPSGILHEDKYR